MKTLTANFALVVITALIGCGRHSEAPSRQAGGHLSAAGMSHYEDRYFALDYPPEYFVKGTPPIPAPGLTPLLMIKLLAPPRDSTVGDFSFGPDPLHPDMLVDDAAAAMAKDFASDGGRLLGGIRKLPVRNGSCTGFIDVSALVPCPAKAGFTPPNGKCHAVNLMAFCESPSHKHFALASTLGDLPTPDRLTPEAAAIGKAHERILSTLEFK